MRIFTSHWYETHFRLSFSGLFGFRNQILNALFSTSIRQLGNQPPSELNWCQQPIDELYDFLETEQTKSFIVLKDGKIVLEYYFGTYTQDSLWLWYSAAND